MSQQPSYGPENPHPLSQLKTELVWEGKYDEYGNRRPINLPHSNLPLQRIETIDEPQDRAKATQLTFDAIAFQRSAHRDDFRNMLIWGDNKLALAALLERYRGKVDLIYIDPPFDVGADFTMQVQIGDEGEAVEKEQSILEAVAYRDTWGKGTDSYLHMMYERLTLLRELLSDTGSIYVHCDWRMNYLLRSIINEVFNTDCFNSDIIWKKIRVVKAQSSGFGNVHDSIIMYSKSMNNIFNQQFTAQNSDYEKKFDKIESSTGRRYQLVSLIQEGQGEARKFGEKVLHPGAGKHWIWSQERIDQAMIDGLIEFTSGGSPRKKQYLDQSTQKIVDDLWIDVFPVNSQAREDTGYATQKPEALLERIIKASSNEGDLVLDCFCGSGTTLATAEKLGRRWIGIDLGRYAIHTSRKRLISVQRELHTNNQAYRSFDVYNLGRYERQWWQRDRLRGADDEHRNLVLRFYKAAAIANPPHPALHATKSGAYVHVDQIDGIFTLDELEHVARAASAVGARELHCLAWEFAMDLATQKSRIEAEQHLSIKLKYIPREIMEANRNEVQFFETGSLSAEALINSKGQFNVALARFSPSLAEAPSKEIAALRERAINSPFDFIDFWAVDFNWSEGKPFEHHWQDFRTRKDRSLKQQTDLNWQYEQAGTYRICVKVIDVFGVDTTTVLTVQASGANA
ncbi:site-specific DNA-methyltransferase [Herpetosiphon geysericola]|uniref:DNA methyltransferase n=1 Tax=Herpetosiphon geysericola TaxID=70996 RepID=A0A0P6YJB3_9CHLR|nr:site-specific DNA-methyltransferase [Herpetosiphon geysericola]KPL90670.1 DNA methyltransferase [Herpetosiphon geysericola]